MRASIQASGAKGDGGKSFEHWGDFLLQSIRRGKSIYRNSKHLSMKTIYTFDEKELAFLKVVQDALAQNKAELDRRLRNIAELNGIVGDVVLAPDSKGFLVAELPEKP